MSDYVEEVLNIRRAGDRSGWLGCQWHRARRCGSTGASDPWHVATHKHPVWSERALARPPRAARVSEWDRAGECVACIRYATGLARVSLRSLAHYPGSPGLVIDSIRIGDEEQTLTPGASVELYGTNALTDTKPDNFSPVQTGTTVTITLRNTTAGNIDVTLGMKGGVER